MSDGGILKEYKGLPESIYLLFLARIVTSLGTFVYPFLTLFLSDKMHMEKDKLGLFISLLAFFYVPGLLAGGKLSDSFGRKKTFIISISLEAFDFIIVGFLIHSFLVPYLLIVVSFFDAAAQPANNAMMLDLTDSKNRKTIFSFLYLGSNIGVSVGPLIAGFLYNNYTQWIFFGDAITTLLSVLIIVFFIKETAPSKEKLKKSFEINTGEKSEKGNLFTVLLKKPSLIAFSLVLLSYSFVYGQNPFAIPLQTKEIFGAADGSKIFGMIMSVNALVVVTMTTFLTKITQRFNVLLNIFIAGLLFSVGFGMLYFAWDILSFIISTILWSLGEILSNTNANVYFANNTPISHRGRFNSLIPMITGSGFAIGPALMGIYLKGRPARDAWPLIAVLAALGAALMYLLFYMEKKANTPY